MSQTIDDRVVEMQFDNRDFERNVRTSMTTLERLKETLNFSGAMRGMTELSAASKKFDLSGVGDAVDVVKSRFSALEVMAITTLANITNSAVNYGKRIAASLTTEPIKEGFQEYELKMGSVQTILNSALNKDGTAVTLDTVMQKLNELNAYSDKTIYSFKDMTSNIGKFTNAGVDLETAVSAIQGVSNVAAISGANAQEASRAMYNFSQALSAGYVKLIDWKSIENANMATVDFKNQLLETAVSIGTVEKTADGMYKVLGKNATGGTMKEAISATKNFNDSLSYQWMTTDVLTQTLAKYTDETTEIGKKAFAAATEVKTFSQLLDTLKESVGSGWAESWELVFGNFEEAKALWTGVNNAVSRVLDAQANARNSIIRDWKELGGRETMIKGFSNMWMALSTTLTTVKNAFRDVFPATTGEQLNSWTEKFASFTERLKPSVYQLRALREALSGFFRIIKVGVDAVKIVGSAIVSLMHNFTGLGDVSKGLLSNLADVFNAIADKISDLTLLRTIVGGVTGVIQSTITKIKELKSAIAERIDITSYESISNVLGKIKDFVKGAASGLANVISGFAKGLGNMIKDGSLNNLSKLFMSGLSATVIYNISDAISKFRDILSNFGKTMKGASENVGAKGAFTEVLGALKDTLEGFQKSIKANILLKIAAAVVGLSIAINVLSKIDGRALAKSLGAVGVAMSYLVASIYALNKMNLGESSSLGTVGLFMIEMAVGVSVLASAVKKLSDMNIEQLLTGLGGVLTLMLGLAVSVNSLNVNQEKLLGIGVAMIGMSVAIRVLSSAVKSLSGLNVKQLLTGLSGVIALMFTMALVTDKISGSKRLVSAGIGMTAMAASILVLSIVVKSLSQIQYEELTRGLLGFASIVAVISIALIGISKMGTKASTLMTVGMAFVGISTALLILVGVTKILASMDFESMFQGIIGLSTMLLLVAAALRVATGTLGGAASILIAAAAITVLGTAVLIFGKAKLSTIGKGILLIGGALVTFLTAASVATAVAPGLVVLAGTITLLGVGMLAAGAGITLFSAGIAALGVALGTGASAIALGLTTVISAILGLAPAFGHAIGETIVAVADALSNGATSIVSAMKVIILAIVEALTDAIPTIVSCGLQLINGLLAGIAANIGGIATSAILIVTNFISAISKQTPAIIQAASDLMLNFINGLADGIRNNTGPLLDALGNLMSSIAEAFLTIIQYLVEDIPLVGDKMASGLETAKDGIRNALSFDTMSSIGADAAESTAAGLESQNGELESAGASMGNSIMDGINSSIAEGGTSGIGSVLGSKITDSMSEIDMEGIGEQLGVDLTDGMEDVDVASAGTAMGIEGSDAASKTAPQFTSAGKNAGAGFVSGIRSYYSTAGQVGGTLGSTSLAGLKSALGIHSPSVEYGEAGRFSVLGFVNAIKKFAHIAADASAEMGEDSLDSLRDALLGVRSIADTDFMNPVITPVLDLNTISEQMGQFNSMFGQRSVNLAQAISGSNDSFILQKLDSLAASIDGLRENMNNGTTAAMFELMQAYFPEFAKPITMDGRTVSRQISGYVNDDISSINRFNNLLAGVK